MLKNIIYNNNLGKYMNKFKYKMDKLLVHISYHEVPQGLLQDDYPVQNKNKNKNKKYFRTIS